MTTSFTVALDEAGERVDRVVARRLGLSRGEVARRVAAGLVRTDGQVVVRASQRVDADVRVEVAQTTPEPAPAPPVVAVRWRDDHLAVIAKPAGLVVHAGAGTTGPTLVDALRAQGVALADTGDAARPGVVHRLDRGTSGLLVVASSEAARAGLVAAFARHDVDRRYWALVDGVPDPAYASIDAPIGRDPNRRVRFRVEAGGRRAVSHYDVVDDMGRAARVEVRLETGRTHQVRVHMAAVGHPVCGDVTYGADTARAERVGLRRPALHAARLGFDHPVTGEPVVLDEPVPDDLAAAHRLLGGASPN